MTTTIITLLLSLFIWLSPTTFEPPPPGEEVGTYVGSWDGYLRDLDGVIVRSDAEWQELLAKAFPDGAPPLEHGSGPGPDFTNAVAVVTQASVCTGSLTLRHLGEGELQFHVHGAERGVVCDLRPAMGVWQVDLDDLGVAREDVTLSRP